MSFLVLQAYLRLVQFDLYLARGKFSVMHRKVASFQVRKSSDSPAPVERICAAVDLACIWYWKEVRCLQRAAATTCLLKQNGTAAQMVIGTQQMPFRAHAWVEVDGRVVNDKTYMREMYSVLDQC
jgi:hypothetical protein